MLIIIIIMTQMGKPLNVHVYFLQYVSILIYHQLQFLPPVVVN